MSLITQGKINLTYLLIVIVIAIIAGGGILFYYYPWIADLDARLAQIELNLPEIKVPGEIPIDETADWKTYQSKTFGFEFKYPNEWTIDDFKEPLTLKDENKDVIISLSFANRAVLGISFCAAYPQDKKCEFLNTGDFNIIIYWGDGGTSAEIDINTGTALFVTLQKVTGATKGIFKQMLFTFKFLE